MMRMHFHYARLRGILLAMVIAAADRNTGKIALRRAQGQRPPLSPQFKPGRFSAKRGAIELRDVVVYVDGRAENTGTLEFAAALAFEHGAHLIGVFIQPELALSPAEMFVRGKGIEDVVAAHQGKLSGIETDRRALFESVARRHGIRAEWRLVPSADSSESAVHARYGDFAMVGLAAIADMQRDRIVRMARPASLWPHLQQHRRLARPRIEEQPRNLDPVVIGRRHRRRALHRT